MNVVQSSTWFACFEHPVYTQIHKSYYIKNTEMDNVEAPNRALETHATQSRPPISRPPWLQGRNIHSNLYAIRARAREQRLTLKLYFKPHVPANPPKDFNTTSLRNIPGIMGCFGNLGIFLKSPCK